MLLDDNTVLALMTAIVLVTGGLKTILPGTWVLAKALALAAMVTLVVLFLYLVSQPSLPGRTDIWPIAKTYIMLLFGAGGAYSVFDVARTELKLDSARLN